MLYYDFQNYEEFKEIFGIVEHGNGVKSRKNRILLAAYKDKALFRRHVHARYIRSLKTLRNHFASRYYATDKHDGSACQTKNRSAVKRIYSRYYYLCDCHDENILLLDVLSVNNVPMAKKIMYRILTNANLYCPQAWHRLHLMEQTFLSDKYETDDMEGLCEDGTLNAIRYRNVEKDRVFKMRAGKMFGNIWECNVLTSKMPEQMLRWMGEEFVADWTEYAREHLCNEGFTLHVDDNFRDIYDTDCCKGYDEDSDSFGSCMVNDDQWTFYRDSVKAKAAYLTDEDGMIVARCILFTEVKDQEGRVWRLAERQYSAFCDDSLKRQLVTALIRDGHIDGYKRVGSSCHDGRDFVDNEGNSLADKMFSIGCNLDYGDTLSYQDSFKSYDIDSGVATNWGAGNLGLDTTSRCLEEPEDDHYGEVWSEWNEEYICEDEAYYVDTRSDYFYGNQVVYASVRRSDGSYYEEDCFEEDCIEIDGDWYYAGFNAESPEDYGIVLCAGCGEWMVKADSLYSDLTEAYYCCEDCLDGAEEKHHRDNGHAFSEYDNGWFEDPDDVITALVWIGGWPGYPGRYVSETISVESFNDLVERGKAAEFNGDYYEDEIMYDGEPAHIGQAVNAA